LILDFDLDCSAKDLEKSCVGGEHDALASHRDPSDAVEAHVSVVHLVDVPPVDEAAPLALPRPRGQLDPENLGDS